MPNRLKNLVINEVSMVDRPADPNAKVALFKRDDEDDDPPGYTEWVTKRFFSAQSRTDLADAGKAMSDGSFPIVNREDLANAIRLVGRAKDPARARAHIIRRARAMNALDALPDDWRMSKIEGLLEKLGLFSKDGEEAEEEGSSESSQEEVMDFDKSALPPEAQAAFDELEKERDEALAEVETLSKANESDGEGEEPTAEELLKNADPAIRAMLEKAENDAAAAKTEAESAKAIAKAEQERRINREFFEKAQSLPHISEDTEELRDLLKEASATLGDDGFTKLEGLLKAANEQINEGKLFAELGSGFTDSGSAFTKLDKMAKAKAADNDDMTYEQAFDEVMEENPELYAEYEREV